MCERIDSKLSFCECEIGDGDIICFQKSLRNHCSEQYRFPDVPSFLEYVHNRQIIKLSIFVGSKFITLLRLSLPEELEVDVPSSDFPTKRHQPIEVAPAGTASMVDVQAVDDLEAVRFTWTINNFSRLMVKELYSEVFNVGGYKWRIWIFPKGNNVVDCLSIYLDVADSARLPYGWSRCALFSLAVLNQVQNKLTVKKATQHQFKAGESAWGFKSFMFLSALNDPGRGYLVDDRVIIEADVVMA
ncbi:PREDICTED: ubiquitin carboxyl-terminal hydrolase 13-like isoform X1 [Nicotiana attenuata]|nr:PREDICTED: ubiquitin carboxyl-terminal hydrolase 13-like isoform X1 [Nicotiana attenuata]XP_019245569.1 PREDICTED: ubiquitin carboxyl-terminal hydrolase 13-like isoform X1 [Nicotiana attenuata]XP_019245570.1 PREDICTED: ubiquitin carboxyl-terminal hydrolase 13-like isoform X1 [Nicotiana attenuata]